MREEFFDDFAGAARAGSFDKGKSAFRMAVAYQRAQVIEVNLDQAGTREELPDAANALDQQAAGDAEGLKDAGVFVDELESFLVRQANHAVGDGFETVHALERLLLTAIAFAGTKGRVTKASTSACRAFLRRTSARPGADAAARAAAKSGNNENDLRSFASRFERGKLFLRKGVAAFGIAAGAQPAKQLGLEMYFNGRGGRGQGLRIRINSHEVRAGKFAVVQGFAQGDACAADAKNFNDVRVRGDSAEGASGREDAGSTTGAGISVIVFGFHGAIEDN